MTVAAIEPEPVPLARDDAGRLVVTGTQVPLDTLVAAFERGDSPESIHEAYNTVSLGDIYAVFTYCVRHREQVNAYLAERQKQRSEMQAEVEARFPVERIARRESSTAGITVVDVAAPDAITPYADLDLLLIEMLGHWRRILGRSLFGAYIQGSFALGSGDQQSDCDWLVATRGPLTEPQIAELRKLHDEIPTQVGHWRHDIEGSYAPADELASVDYLGRKWLFNDHGHRSLEWDDHCNRGYVRWILREHGITLTGPKPASFMPVVPAGVLRHEAAASLPALLDDLATWIDIDAVAWGQRYAVVTACRILYTLDTARVASKPAALEWAQRTLDPRWRPLLAQVRDERRLGWQPNQPPHRKDADAARAFVTYAATWSDNAAKLLR